MYFILCVLGLVACQAFGDEICPLFRSGCGLKHRTVLRQEDFGHGASYEQCLTNNTRGRKIVTKCERKIAKRVIGRKMCTCNSYNIVNAVSAPVSLKRDISHLCLSDKDLYLPNCPRRAALCYQYSKNFTNSISRRNPRPGSFMANFLQCTDEEKGYVTEMIKCIDEFKSGSIDLKECGSIYPIAKMYSPFLSIGVKFACSGCDIIKIIEDCSPVPHYRLQMCTYLLNKTMLLDYVTCIKRNVSASPSCSSVSLPRIPYILRTIRTAIMTRLVVKLCIIERRVMKVYNSWNCPGQPSVSADGDTITRKKREMKNYDLLDLLAEYLQ